MKNTGINKTHILVVGNDELLTKRIMDQLGSMGYQDSAKATGAEDAIEKFHQSMADVVVLTNDLPAEVQNKLRSVFRHQHSEVILLPVVDSEWDLVKTIELELQKQIHYSRPRWAIVDDALKNAGLDIVVQ